MNYYPLLINLTGSSCLIVGAGNVAKRKLKLLLASNPEQIVLLDINPPSAELKKLFHTHQNIHFEQRSFQPEDIQGKTLVFATTNNQEVNSLIALYCKNNGILCNSSTNPQNGSFIVPSSIKQGEILVSISTNGASPALTSKLKNDISVWLNHRYTKIAEFLSRLRPLVLKNSNCTESNTTLFCSIVNSELTDALNAQNSNQCKHILQEILPPPLQTHIMELLHELV